MMKGHGPIPEGRYTMGEWYDDPGGKGPVVCKLEPHPDNQMGGRSGFMIHGDNSLQNHTGSDGCIIIPRFARVRISTDADQELEVVRGQIDG
jgi:hypothetical protein